MCYVKYAQNLYQDRRVPEGSRDVRHVIVSDHLGEMFCVDNISVVIDSGFRHEWVRQSQINMLAGNEWRGALSKSCA